MKLPLFQPDAETATRFLFFTGKGGVGKTSLSCATALKLVDAGKRVLLVSTDPASNLDEVLETKLTNAPVSVEGVPGLDALNINPVEAAASYRERLIGPMRGLLPEAALRSMEEQLSGSCTVEIAAFDEFSGLIGNAEAAKDYDHVIFDTAPTGHTLRLMSLAKAWDQFLDKNTSGTSCLGPLAGLEKQRVINEATVETLAGASATTLVLVSRPQGSALREAERTSRELRTIGVGNQCLVVNGTFETDCPEDVTAQAIQQRGLSALTAAGEFIGSMPSFIVPLRPINILGVGGLRLLLSGDAAGKCVKADESGWAPPEMECFADHRYYDGAAGQGRDYDDGQRRSGQDHGRRRHRRDARTDRFVVLDTAPTGHTLLLLDASEAYQRELERQARSSQPEEVLKLLERLRDPDFTRILLVTLPEATPVHEAAALQEDLRRARIEPFAWVINQSLLNSGSRDPLLQRREASEHPYLSEVVEKHAGRTTWLPWQSEEPIGPDALAKLASSNLQPV